MSTNKHLILLAIALIAPSALAISIPKCPHGNLDLDAQAGLLHKIAILGEDGRSKLKDKEHPEVGTLWCAGFASTAQLSGSNGVITAASHAFLDENCKMIVSDTDECSFEPPRSPRRYPVDIKTLKSGCPKKRQDDWAVVRLKSSVPDGQFLAIPSKEMELSPGSDIKQISVRFNPASMTVVRYQQNCNVREMHPAFLGAVAFHDCDTERSASGGAQIVEHENQHYLMAIHIGGKSKETLDRSGRTKPGEYDGNENRNISLTVTGKFREAILELVGTQPSQ